MNTCFDYGCAGCENCIDYESQTMTTPTECNDNDSPWLICKTCVADGKCARTTRTEFEAAALPPLPEPDQSALTDGYVGCVLVPATPDKFYIEGSSDIETIIEQAMKKWPQTNHQLNLDRLRITSEYIHTHCLGYDLYDPGDYTNYLCIELVN